MIGLESAMMWKLYAISMTIFFAVGLTYAPRDIIDIASIPIDAIASVGLLAYAFRLRQAHNHLWAFFAWFFAAWGVVSVSVGAIRSSVDGSPAYAIVGASLFAALLFYPKWLALYRLGRVYYA
jgi:hypothetical protein